MGEVCIVAELASAHDGKLSQAYALIDAAAAAGCSAAKAVFWSDADKMARRRNVAIGSYYHGVYKAFQPGRDWLVRLRDYSWSRGMRFDCSIYLPQDADFVAQYADHIKVAGFENGDAALLEAALATGRPVTVSAGMLDDPALRRLRAWPVSILQCTNYYGGDMPLSAVNLAVIRAYGLDGLSDHSRRVDMGGWAVKGAGAYIRMLEVHARLETTNPKNPDYAPALNPDELKRYVYLARHPDEAGPVPPEVMGTGVKVMQDCERECAQWRVKA